MSVGSTPPWGSLSSAANYLESASGHLRDASESLSFAATEIRASDEHKDEQDALLLLGLASEQPPVQAHQPTSSKRKRREALPEPMPPSCFKRSAKRNKRTVSFSQESIPASILNRLYRGKLVGYKEDIVRVLEVREYDVRIQESNEQECTVDRRSLRPILEIGSKILGYDGSDPHNRHFKAKIIGLTDRDVIINWIAKNGMTMIATIPKVGSHLSQMERVIPYKYDAQTRARVLNPSSCTLESDPSMVFTGFQLIE